MVSTRLGYMCAVDFEHEIGEAAGGTKVYATLNDLLKHSPCVHQCGAVRVKVEVIEQVMVENFEERHGRYF